MSLRKTIVILRVYIHQFAKKKKVYIKIIFDTAFVFCLLFHFLKISSPKTDISVLIDAVEVKQLPVYFCFSTEPCWGGCYVRWPPLFIARKLVAWAAQHH